MDFELHLEQPDWTAFQQHLQQELPKSVRAWHDTLWFKVITWVVMACIFLAAFRLTSVHWPSVGITLSFCLFVGILYFLDLTKLRKAYRPSEDGPLIGTHKYMITKDGIGIEGADFESSYTWKAVQKIERVNGLILVYVDSIAALVFPESKLKNPDEFYGTILEYKAET